MDSRTSFLVDTRLDIMDTSGETSCVALNVAKAPLLIHFKHLPNQVQDVALLLRRAAILSIRKYKDPVGQLWLNSAMCLCRAQVMSIDGFSAFQELGMSNTVAIDKEGIRYRDTILSLGGARAPGLVFKVISFHA